LAITVTSPQGATLSDIRVQLSGPTDRSEQTNASGQLSMPSLLTGTYRLRFEGEKVVTFEKEVTVQTGKVTQVDVMLNPAPEPKVVSVPAGPVSPPTPTAAGPKGDPRTLEIPNVLDKEFVGRQPRRESLLACTGNMRTSMIQLNDPLPTRLYDSADAIYYVLGGEGTIQMNGKDTKLNLNDFASVPRGTSHSFTRRGSRALVLLAVLSGAPCEEAK
jgi:mannose-6-phosphate isomerase-like protein (cupin superfamily)